MKKIKGIYAAGMSVFNDDLSLNIVKTINHAERIIDKAVMVLLFLEALDKHNLYL